jgi:hypothetical protein
MGCVYCVICSHLGQAVDGIGGRHPHGNDRDAGRRLRRRHPHDDERQQGTLASFWVETKSTRELLVARRGRPNQHGPRRDVDHESPGQVHPARARRIEPGDVGRLGNRLPRIDSDEFKDENSTFVTPCRRARPMSACVESTSTSRELFFGPRGRLRPMPAPRAAAVTLSRCRLNKKQYNARSPLVFKKFRTLCCSAVYPERSRISQPELARRHWTCAIRQTCLILFKKFRAYLTGDF